MIAFCQGNGAKNGVFVVVLRPSYSVAHRDISDAGCPKKEEKLLFAFQEVEKVISLLNAKRAEGLFSLSICMTGQQLKEASHANNAAPFFCLEVFVCNGVGFFFC